MEIMLSDKSSSKNILNVGLNLDNMAVDFTSKGEDLKVKDSKRPTVLPDSCLSGYPGHQVYAENYILSKSGHIGQLLGCIWSSPWCQVSGIERGWCLITIRDTIDLS